MLLAGGESAVVELRKLRDYVLNPLHPRGKHKARVFATALAIVQSDAECLRNKLKRAASTGDAALGEVDSYGQRYIVDFECVKGERRAIIRSTWIVLTGESLPRLTTCFELSE